MRTIVRQAFMTKNGKTYQVGDTLEGPPEVLAPLLRKGRISPLGEPTPTVPPSPEAPSCPDPFSGDPTVPETPETGLKNDPDPPSGELDPVVLSERIGIKFGDETPDTLGKPVFIYRGHPLAWEHDPAHIKVYAWATVNLYPGRPLSVDIDSTARLLGLTTKGVRDALARLVKDGDLVRTMERGRELYQLVIRYGEETP